MEEVQVDVEVHIRDWSTTRVKSKSRLAYSVLKVAGWKLLQEQFFKTRCVQHSIQPWGSLSSNKDRNDVLIVGNDNRGYGFIVASPNEEERLLREARNEARQERIKQARLAFSKKSRETIRKKQEIEEQRRMSAQNMVEMQNVGCCIGFWISARSSPNACCRVAVLDQKREQSQCPLAIQSRNAKRLERTRTIEAERERIRAQADRRFESNSLIQQEQVQYTACTTITQRVKVSESQPLGSQPRLLASKKHKQDYGQTRFHAVQIFRHNHQNVKDNVPHSLFDANGEICIVNAHEAAKAMSMINASQEMQRSIKFHNDDKKAKQRETEAKRWLEKRNTANRVMEDLVRLSSKQEKYYKKSDSPWDAYHSKESRRMSIQKSQKQKEHDLIDALLGPLDEDDGAEHDPAEQAITRDDQTLDAPQPLNRDCDLEDSFTLRRKEILRQYEQDGYLSNGKKAENERLTKNDELQRDRQIADLDVKKPDDLDVQPKATSHQAVIDLQHLHQAHSSSLGTALSSEDSLDEEEERPLDGGDQIAEEEKQGTSDHSRKQHEFLSQIDRILTMHESRGTQAKGWTQPLTQGGQTIDLGSFPAPRYSGSALVQAADDKNVKDDLEPDVDADDEECTDENQPSLTVVEKGWTSERDERGSDLAFQPPQPTHAAESHSQQQLADDVKEDSELSTEAIVSSTYAERRMESKWAESGKGSTLVNPDMEEASPQPFPSRLTDMKLSFVASGDVARAKDRKEMASQVGGLSAASSSGYEEQRNDLGRNALHVEIGRAGEELADDSDLELSDTPPSSPSQQSSSSWGLPPFQVPELSSSPNSSRTSKEIGSSRERHRTSDEKYREAQSRDNYSSVLSSLRSLSEVPSIEMSPSSSESDGDDDDEGRDRGVSMSRSDAEAQDLDSMTELRVSDELSSSLLHLRLEEQEAAGAAEMKKWSPRHALQESQDSLEASEHESEDTFSLSDSEPSKSPARRLQEQRGDDPLTRRDEWDESLPEMKMLRQAQLKRQVKEEEETLGVDWVQAIEERRRKIQEQERQRRDRLIRSRTGPAQAKMLR
ncbi:hypothetical protein GUITHDRAFT_146412 [Guillardia theta CCMP2712]|uniref:Uncharacterized protein n=3 Tax=Guillardia theta TaxID=55529 RepID=L1II19_GUITC|nr:hypothetical protein GUITHDRAFT_146412 [Guillardia theta CCMP2712]EKX35589.1 hypothetical protein GUITHDRAFT_146412 [Guillardia theta CCMP2712]|eukprot:XP_005822569.1 hypothetical protein GUITHDRAFT_146412 [Guillardia theta CCMP2712]